MSKNIIDLLNKRMPKLLNVNEELYEALFGKVDFTPLIPIAKSEDYQCGAIANELEYLRSYIDFMSATNDVENAEGELLELMIAFMVDLIRIWDETDDDLRNRLYALIRRQSNVRWMTIWSMIDVFSYFFSKDDIYPVENYVETNLLLNGGFEDGSGNNFDNWTKYESGSSVIVEATGGDEFIGDRAAEYQIDSSNSLAYLDQTINTVAQGNYKIDLFYWDDGLAPGDYVIRVSIIRGSDNWYWNFTNNTWQSGMTGALIPKKGISKYTYWGAYVYQENGTPENITVRIARGGGGGAAYKFRIDEVNFGEWKDHPSFKLLTVVDILAGPGDLNLWNGSGEDNLMDRGECESTTSPMIFDETVPYEPNPANQTWQRVSTSPYMGSYNWQLQKDTTTGNGDAETFLTDNKNTTDMHGLTAGQKYTLAFRGKPDEITNPHKVRIYEYYSGGWNPTDITLDTAGSWKRYSQTITLNAATTGVAISVFIDTNAAQNSTLDIDNIRLFEGDDADIEKAGFFDNDYIFGSGGGYSSSLYDNIMEKIRPAGVKGVLEIEGA
jgi:hypothetical protein